MILVGADIEEDCFEEAACWKNEKLRWDSLLEESEVYSSWQALGQSLPNTIHQFCEN